jgi:alpha-tubulin suppressor-like RCC1 family protein
MPTFNFKDNDGIDIGNKYVTKEYVMDVYPNLIPSLASPELWTWGWNNATYGGAGQLGDGTTSNRSLPVTVGGGATWTQAAGGEFQTAGIKSDGTLWTWGHNQWGQLGTGNTTSRSSPGTTAGGGTNWKQVATGWLTMAAVKTDGTLWTWGYDGYGILGAGTLGQSRSSPGTTAGGGTNWKQVAVASYNMAAVKTDGTLWTWGIGGAGRLGTGATTDRSSPGTTAGGGTNWKQVAVGKSEGWVAAVKTDGTLWTWGTNGSGQLGTGNTTDRSSPGTTAGGGTNWKMVGCAWVNYMAGIKTDGTLWTWGDNTRGQLGTGNTTSRSSPGTTAGGGTDWKQIDNTLGNEFMHALKTDGTLWSWGYDSNFGLGSTGVNLRSSPVTVTFSKNTWKSVSMGRYHVAAIAENGDW